MPPIKLKYINQTARKLEVLKENEQPLRKKTKSHRQSLNRSAHDDEVSLDEFKKYIELSLNSQY